MNHELHISHIDFYLIQPKEGLIGFVNFLIEGAVAINGVGIYERMDGTGIRLVYPVRKLTSGKQINIIHPISQAIGSHIERQVASHLSANKNFRGKYAERRQELHHSK